MTVIGITGGIGCGKSTVCGYLKEKYDACVLMADDVGHDVMAPGGCAYDALKMLLGDEYILPDKTFDRKKIGNRAFKEPGLLEKMNAIIHPAVHESIIDTLSEAEKSGREFGVVEAALLIEAGYRDICSEYWYVYTDEELRIKRLMASRDITEEKARDVMKRQLSEDEFRKNCEFVVLNNNDFKETAKQIDERIEYLRAGK